jgi:hypothetical protein
MSHTLIAKHELFKDNVADAAVLIAMHWKEMYGPEGLRANFGGISDTEAVGGFKYFTLRDESNVLAGHLGMMLINTPYYNKTIAMDIFYYVLPEYRGSFAICKLLKFGAQVLKNMGVQQINVSHPEHKDLGVVLKRAGFHKSSDMYTFGE